MKPSVPPNWAMLIAVDFVNSTHLPDPFGRCPRQEQIVRIKQRRIQRTKFVPLSLPRS